MGTIEKVMLAIVIPIGLFLLYMLFVVVPVALYTESKCLAAGYPKAHVTIGLETYCSNLHGTVTVRVEKLK